MNYRLNTTAIVAAVLFVVIAAGLFIYTLVSAPHEVATNEPTEIPLRLDDQPMIISGKHQFVDKLHTVAGTFTVGSPCESILVEPFFPNGTTDQQQVELRFTTVIEGADCQPTLTDTAYHVTFEAPEQATISGTLNGTPVRLNLVPVAPGESIGTASDFKG